jgi:hypothetical protein
MPVPGVGPVAATTVATVGTARAFTNGRHVAAWLGLVPRHHASGGRRRLGRIPTRGDVDLRTVRIQGARAIMRPLARRPDAISRWGTALHARPHQGGRLATGRTSQPPRWVPARTTGEEASPSSRSARFRSGWRGPVGPAPGDPGSRTGRQRPRF